MKPARELPRSWAPGYHGVNVSPETLRLFQVAADVMIPGDDHYPSASAAGVPDFIATRISAKHLAQFEAAFEAQGPADLGENTVAAWLSEIEATDIFTVLRWYVYSAYYASPVVVSALNQRGLDYHGPPQPLGYQIDVEPPTPTHQRGSYIPTDRVSPR